MSAFQNFLLNLPEVSATLQKKLAFKEKLKWTLIVLVLFFLLGIIPLFGLGDNSLQRFELLQTILGAEFGHLLSLGIGPIVTASIVLQLLNGSGLVKFDTSTPEGRRKFQGVQKLLAIFFIIFEAAIYVYMGGLDAGRAILINPETGVQTFVAIGTEGAVELSSGMVSLLQLILVFQLFLGGLIVLFMDEIVSKWGFGSGISLFIAAGVSKSLFIQLFSPLQATGTGYVGAVPQIITSVIGLDYTGAMVSLAGIAATVAVFVAAVYAQSMKVEIPLSFGRIRGHGIRWPLNFMYTSNIPVILVSALFANFQLWGSLLERWANSSGSGVLTTLSSWFGTFQGSGQAVGGLLSWLQPPKIIKLTIESGFVDGFLRLLPHVIVYILFLIIGCIIFSWFWVQTAGMDAKSQAKQIMNSGLQMPGFRRDPRVLEKLLERKINPLTIMGAISVGLLAGLADVSGALTSGTGLLLTVMIVYKLYEDIAKQHMMDVNPLVKKFMGG